jgi:hypothetical protein
MGRAKTHFVVRSFHAIIVSEPEGAVSTVLVVMVVVSALENCQYMVDSLIWDGKTYVSARVGVRARGSKKGREPASMIAVVLMVTMVMVTGGCYTVLANDDVDVGSCNGRGYEACENERVLHDG